jgi:hypothetical protein
MHQLLKNTTECDWGIDGLVVDSLDHEQECFCGCSKKMEIACQQGGSCVNYTANDGALPTSQDSAKLQGDVQEGGLNLDGDCTAGRGDLKHSGDGDSEHEDGRISLAGS